MLTTNLHELTATDKNWNTDWHGICSISDALIGMVLFTHLLYATWTTLHEQIRLCSDKNKAFLCPTLTNMKISPILDVIRLAYSLVNGRWDIGIESSLLGFSTSAFFGWRHCWNSVAPFRYVFWLLISLQTIHSVSQLSFQPAVISNRKYKLHQ